MTAPARWSESEQLLEVHEALIESEARLHALLSSLDDLVFELDEDGTYLGIWTLRDDLLVAPRGELLGRNVREFLGGDLAAEVVRTVRQALATGEPGIIEYSLQVPSGERWFQGRVARIGTERRRSVCFLSRDITGAKLAEQARDDAEERLRHQALHDGLTGLANRTHFREQLDKALWTCRRAGDGLAVLMLDIDRFKEINDSLGHAAGDVVLEEVARRLATVTREGDVIARIGGDEFALLLPHAGAEEAAAVAARVSRCLEESIALDGILFDVAISTGVAVCPHDGLDADSLLRRADLAMYAAKRRSAGFSSGRSLDLDESAKLALEAELHGALDRGELIVYYQPMLDLSTRAVSKVEALVRWLHPERGLVPPDRFIPLLEETAIVTAVTRCVLEQAVGWCRTWFERGRELGVAVNLALCDLIDVGLPHDVARLLGAHGVPPRLLSFEVTEQAVMADPRRTKAILDRLSHTGVQLSVGNLGAGYSSLAHLAHLPFDEVKIDRSLVTNMVGAPADEAIVRSVIESARSLGRQVVAEGVESDEILRRVEALGCDRAQGYYVGGPLAADDLDRWLSSRHAWQAASLEA